MSPAELLFGRISRSHLDLLKPDVSTHVKDKQQAQRGNHEVHPKERRFEVGDPVFVKEFPSGKHWLPGVISSVEGPQSYHVTLTDNRVVRRHVDHVMKRSSEIPQSDSETVGEFPGYPSTEGPATPVAAALPVGRPTSLQHQTFADQFGTYRLPTICNMIETLNHFKTMKVGM